ncbi:MAG: TetR/AcrR family transcriptional regulator [bacterium]|nr:TetR/AcrR family transcriptional regulator [bacterium]
MATAPVSLEWIRPPRQARSQATLDRLLDAAEDLLNEKGWEDTSVAQIANRAGSSVGSFYARFQDKDAVLNALHERFIQEAWVTAEAALNPERWKGASVAAITAELVRFQIRSNSERLGLLRALQLRTVVDYDFQVRSISLNRHIHELFFSLLMERRMEIMHPAPAAAAQFVVRMLFGVLQQKVLFGPILEATGALAEKDLIEELTYACLAYLGVFPESTER